MGELFLSTGNFALVTLCLWQPQQAFMKFKACLPLVALFIMAANGLSWRPDPACEEEKPTKLCRLPTRKMFYWNSDTETCEQFYDAPCDRTQKNRFDTEKKCLDHCSFKHAYETPE